MQAFEVMKHFLEEVYRQTGSDDLGSLLGDLQWACDDMTMDPAAWSGWLRSVDVILSNDTS